MIGFTCVATLALVACNGSETTGDENVNAERVDFHHEGLPLVDEGVDVSLTFVSPKSTLAPDFDEMTIFQRLEEETNVSINWNNIPGDGYVERKNLMLASNDLPDAFYNAGFSDYDLVRYGRDGAIIPLEGLIEEYAPNLQSILDARPELLAVLTAPDGHIYSLPRVEEMGLVPFANFTAINQTWLDEVGLDQPVTLDDLKEALQAFQDQDVNGSGSADEVLSLTPNDGFQGYLGDFFAAFGFLIIRISLSSKTKRLFLLLLRKSIRKQLLIFMNGLKRALLIRKCSLKIRVNFSLKESKIQTHLALSCSGKLNPLSVLIVQMITHYSDH